MEIINQIKYKDLEVHIMHDAVMIADCEEPHITMSIELSSIPTLISILSKGIGKEESKEDILSTTKTLLSSQEHYNELLVEELTDRDKELSDLKEQIRVLKAVNESYVQNVQIHSVSEADNGCLHNWIGEPNNNYIRCSKCLRESVRQL